MVRDKKRERQRLLRLLVQRSAMLETPLNNPVLQEMLDGGEVEATPADDVWWNGRWHKMVRISLTDKGREAEG